MDQAVTPMPQGTAETLKSVTTATLTTILLKKGLRNVWMRGAAPCVGMEPGERIVGRAFTLRFVPAREDLATPASWSSPISTRAAIEAMPDGVIAVVDAMGVADAGIFGDILCSRVITSYSIHYTKLYDLSTVGSGELNAEPDLSTQRSDFAARSQLR